MARNALLSCPFPVSTPFKLLNQIYGLLLWLCISSPESVDLFTKVANCLCDEECVLIIHLWVFVGFYFSKELI